MYIHGTCIILCMRMLFSVLSCYVGLTIFYTADMTISLVESGVCAASSASVLCARVVCVHGFFSPRKKIF